MAKQGTYKFIQTTIRLRWIDYCRIRHCFPAQKGESAAQYFQRLAMWMKEQK